MTILTWRPAAKTDAGELSTFECTEKGRRGRVLRHERKHTKPWELAVQSFIRERRHRCSPSERVWVGLDDEGVAAVFRTDELDGPGDVLLAVAAVALRHRHSGGGVADELVRFCLDEITARAMTQDVSELLVTARIHEENHPSQKLARRNGFIHADWLDDLQVWLLPLTLR